MESMPLRTDPWMQQDIFKDYQSETDLMRYIFRLAEKDFSLVDGMIPLGSCTMKLNSAAEFNFMGQLPNGIIPSTKEKSFSESRYIYLNNSVSL